LRQIPIVSEIFNWLAPAEPVNTIGRTFNLQSGKIASTEVTYKYKLQVEESSNDSGDESGKKLLHKKASLTNSEKTTVENDDTEEEEDKLEEEITEKTNGDKRDRKLSSNSIQTNVSNVAIINGADESKK